jgi:hypothetical protein
VLLLGIGFDNICRNSTGNSKHYDPRLPSIDLFKKSKIQGPLGLASFGETI